MLGESSQPHLQSLLHCIAHAQASKLRTMFLLSSWFSLGTVALVRGDDGPVFGLIA